MIIPSDEDKWFQFESCERHRSPKPQFGSGGKSPKLPRICYCGIPNMHCSLKSPQAVTMPNPCFLVLTAAQQEGQLQLQLAPAPRA